MRITELRIENLRNLAEAAFGAHPDLNVFYGANGAGKTSVLEALFVVSRGKSFRTARAEELIGPKTGAFRIFLGREGQGSTRRIGLERDARQWRARRDGQDVAALSDLSADLPLVLLEPNSHLLVSGPPDGRRRYLDRGVFHVEPGYLGLWRRYVRALRQRNAALRSRDAAVLDGLDPVLAQAGERLNEARSAYCDRLAAVLPDCLYDEKPALRDIALRFEPGWKSGPLAEALAAGRSRDLDQGMSGQGPHRAEIALLRGGQPIRTVLSRGEQKGLAAALLLAQGRMLAEAGERPLFLLDDLASEFDAAHLDGVLEKVRACAGQVWVTGVERLALDAPHSVFHVEHGQVREMV